MIDINKDAIRFIQNGEDVDAEVSNRPVEDVVDHTNLLNQFKRKSIVDLNFIDNRFSVYEFPYGSTLKQLPDILTNQRVSAATLMTPTTITEVGGGISRISYGMDGAPKGLISESQKTNLVLWNNDATNSSWNKATNCVATISSDEGLDLQWSQLSASATTSTALQITQTTNIGDKMTLSTFFKPVGNVKFIMLRLNNPAKDCRVTFDVENGTIASSSFSGNWSIDKYGEYYRVSMSDSGFSVASTGIIIRAMKTFTSSTAAESMTVGENALLTGVQLEESEFVSSLIITENSQVNRTHDFTSLIFSEEIRLKEFTLLVNASIKETETSRMLGMGRGANTDNRLDIRTNGISFFNVDGSVSHPIDVNITNGGEFIIVITYDGSRLKAFKNGELQEEVEGIAGTFTVEQIRFGRGLNIVDVSDSEFKHVILSHRAIDDTSAIILSGGKQQ